MSAPKGKPRIPGDDEVLNNATDQPGSAAEDHEAAVARAVKEAQDKEEATQAQQRASQKGSRAIVEPGAVYVPPTRSAAISKYGPELPFAHGTPLILKAGQNIRPCEGSEQPTHICGRVIPDAKGWLVQRPIPVEEIPGYAQGA